MSLVQSLAARLPAIDARPTAQIEQEIVDELEFHITMRTEENMNQGMSPGAARSAAMAQFGDFAAVRQKCRRALLGERIMWQRIQMVLSVVLLGAVIVLAFQLYSGQRANQAAIDDITSALKQLAPAEAASTARANEVAATNAEAPANNSTPAGSKAAREAIDPAQPYPITIGADKARSFQTFSFDFANFKLQGDDITIIPISTEAGVTGAMLIGGGTYSFEPQRGNTFEGHFHTALLRFNPKDADSIVKLSMGKEVIDKGAYELSKHLLAATFRHCYHSGDDALIPPERALAVDLFSRELGNVLFSIDGATKIVHDFTSRKTLYERK